MGWDRIKWYDSRGMKEHTEVFKDIRRKRLPTWLREECEKDPISRSFKATQFAETGFPFRGEHLFVKEKQ